MKKKDSLGFTLVECMIVVTIICVVAAGAVVGCTSCMATDHQRQTAQTEAEHWAADLGYTLRGVSCADIDSDGDGYVSCTVAIAHGDDTEPTQIECRGAYFWGHGCREPKLSIRGRGLSR